MLDQPRAVIGETGVDGLGVLLQVQTHEDLHSISSMEIAASRARVFCVTRQFTSDYVERATLRDGTPIVLRLITPDDRELLRRGFERLSPESRYTRFLVPKPRLTEDELTYLTEVDQEHHFALGAAKEDGDGRGNPVGLGIARFIRLPERDGEPATAEAAIAVADEVQHQGLGRLLLQRLVAAARERGIERFRCDVLCSNRSMAELIEAIAPDRELAIESGVMSIEFPLPHGAEGPMYELLRAAAKRSLDISSSRTRVR
ncbi:MAG: GNAT family N-acetyltransferase [Acidobacteriota bacterium]